MMNYKQKRWTNLREQILKRDKYLCKECLRYGKKTDAYLVHHIFPASQVKEYRYLKENLISLCNSCHNELHDRNSDELTDKGQQLLERHRERIEEAWQRVSTYLKR